MGETALRMRYRCLLLWCAFALAVDSTAQCGTLAPRGPVPLEGSMERGGGGPFIIPTVVHVFTGTAVQPAAPWVIEDLIEQTNVVLRAQNADLSEICSEFDGIVGDLSAELRLARLDPEGNCISGIVYHPFGPNLTSYGYDPSKYLNIYVYSPFDYSYALIPQPGGDPSDPDDAIFLQQTAANNPRVLAHEVGHWVGLYHTFGNTNTAAVSCGDDAVMDTPVTMGSALNACDTTLSVCTPGVVENVNNIMDYSGCKRMFTQGQAARVAAIMTDVSYPRHMHCSPANLADTGVDPEQSCPMTVDFQYSITTTCDAAVVTVVPVVTGTIPDQFIWSYPGASFWPNTENAPVLTYTASGSYTVKLVACRGAVCDSTEEVIDVTLSAPSNGLQMTSVPYSEDFEDGFSFPDAHMHVLNGGIQDWQLNSAVGYASAHSIVVPAAVQLLADTVEVSLGNFDLSGLAQPAISFKVATSYYDNARWNTLSVVLRDLCNSGVPNAPWNTFEPIAMAGGNTAPGFVPSSPEQWVSLSYTTPSWLLYHNAEFRLRVVKLHYSPPFTDEAIYVDNINIGEYDIITALAEGNGEHVLLAPNPATDLVRVSGRAKDLLRVTDMTGRAVLSQTMRTDQQTVDVNGWARGSYVITLQREGRTLRERMVVE